MFSAENSFLIVVKPKPSNLVADRERQNQLVHLIVVSCVFGFKGINFSLTLKLLTTHLDTVILTLNPAIILVERF